ncbi:MAG: hypothetical protein IVW36_08385 [Dehalococcoidia bacterium]|nr:hypothetical protein [Dehalococcoidia bacterium]
MTTTVVGLQRTPTPRPGTPASTPTFTNVVLAATPPSRLPGTGAGGVAGNGILPGILGALVVAAGMAALAVGMRVRR